MSCAKAGSATTGAARTMQTRRLDNRFMEDMS
jgi:hypothetical protein